MRVSQFFSTFCFLPQEEYVKATRDLQFEVLNGTPLNTIRKRFGQAPVDGDDEPMFPEEAIDPALLGKKQNNNIVDAPVKSTPLVEGYQVTDIDQVEVHSPPPSHQRKRCGFLSPCRLIRVTGQ